MAKRRMFSLGVVDTDAFLEMPATSQNLYFHLGMRADDDGFVSNPKKILKTCGAGEDDLRVLFGKRFILGFQNGIIVIKHWRMHNYIRNDRYDPTSFQDEMATLEVKPNGAYTERKESGIPVGNQLATQVRLGEDSIGEDREREARFIPPSIQDIIDYMTARNSIGFSAEQFHDFYAMKGWMVGKNKMKDWKKAVHTWENRYKQEHKDDFSWCD